MNDVVEYSAIRKVVFRADASLEIGTGHVMRCLTLAEALKTHGAECHFMCREHSGNMIELIEARGFAVHRLPMEEIDPSGATGQQASELTHASWLGASWQQDAAACRPLVEQLAPDWLVVDHYALDARWEDAVLRESRTPPETRLMVIDDLADRPHRADLLLDQNLGRAANDYASLVPTHCRVLAGPGYALLRPEFAELRQNSLARRQHAPLKRLLISLGGVDKDNATSKVLEALEKCDLPDDVTITVVMGATAPWRDAVIAKARELPWATEVVINVNDMARRMADADLAIGAAGSTSWERCCLGLPTLMLVLAENQLEVALMLDALGAAKLLGQLGNIAETLPGAFNTMGSVELARMSQTAASIVVGMGAGELIGIMQEAASDPATRIEEYHDGR